MLVPLGLRHTGKERRGEVVEYKKLNQIFIKFGLAVRVGLGLG